MRFPRPPERKLEMVPAQRIPAALEPRLPSVLEPVAAVHLDSEALVDGLALSAVTADEGAAFIEITACVFVGVRLTGMVFDQLSLVDVVFEDCELSGAIWSSAVLTRVAFRRCRLSAVDMAGMKAKDVRFDACKADGANFRMSVWDRCECIDTDLLEADFAMASLQRCRLTDCNLERVQFHQATLSAVSLHGSQLDGVTGVESLRGAIIGSEQVLSLAQPVLAAIGVEVNDELPEHGVTHEPLGACPDRKGD